MNTSMQIIKNVGENIGNVSGKEHSARRKWVNELNNQPTNKHWNRSPRWYHGKTRDDKSGHSIRKAQRSKKMIKKILTDFETPRNSIETSNTFSKMFWKRPGTQPKPHGNAGAEHCEVAYKQIIQKGSNCQRYCKKSRTGKQHWLGQSEKVRSEASTGWRNGNTLLLAS